MHVGIDCRLPYYRMGGISRYSIQLIRALSQLPGEDRFTVFSSRKDSADYIPAGDGRFIAKKLWTPSHHRLEKWAMAIELLPQKIHVFHSPDFIPPASRAFRRIITVHDLTFLHYPEFLTRESRRYYADQIQWAVKTADHIAADSEATRQDLIALLGVSEEKVTTIHLAAEPIHTIDYNPIAIEQTLDKYDLTKDFILSVGTLEPRKNIPTLLRAYHRILQDHRIDRLLVLVGSKGWIYDDIFREINKLGLTARVRHLESVSDMELAHLYRAAGVLAFPSHYEGFGLPVLEAMHAGCPVIASHRGSLIELVGDAGIMLDPDDIGSWVMALESVLTDSSLTNRLAEAGRQRAAQFSWLKTARATLALYRTD
jgi:glycosyltransferase involved in cell wall biosynthesis